MRFKRTGATIAAGLLTGAAALGFGFGTAQADPVDWVEDATTVVTLSMGEEPGTETLPTGEFTGQVDEDAGTIVGEVIHPEFALPIANPIGDDPPEIDLNTQLTITDVDLAWDQDDDSVAGTAQLQLELVSVAIGDGLPLSPCTALASTEVSGTYVDGVLVFGGEIGGVELDGACAGLATVISGILADLTGSFETTVAPVDAEPEPEPEPEETTTTTEAPGEDPAPNGGATPIQASPSYTG